jgi:hypothetical protein
MNSSCCIRIIIFVINVTLQILVNMDIYIRLNIKSFLRHIKNNFSLNILLQSHTLFFVGDTFVNKIADQDCHSSSKIRSDASGLGWQQR